MNDSHITSVAQLKKLAKITSQVAFESVSRKEMYSWVEEILGRFKGRGTRTTTGSWKQKMAA